MKFNKLIPELTVTDMNKSKDFYTKVLGFKIEYERMEDRFAFLSLGEAQIMLDEINDNWTVGELKYPFGNGINFQIEIEDIEGFVSNVKAQGESLFRDIFISSYQCDDVCYEEKEVLIQDPDGYLLRFSETQKVIIMDKQMICKLCLKYFAEEPEKIERCAVGQGNYVYIVEYNSTKYVVRCSKEKGVYSNTIYWLEKLAIIDVPVPKVIAKGNYNEYEYLILSYIEGKDIGLIYQQLEDREKREIAKQIVHIQNRVSTLELEDIEPEWSWWTFINYMLERATYRIVKNGYFDVEKVERLRECLEQLKDYFASIKPVAYLDDISTKNLLVHNGQISGIIDIDWMGTGDNLTYIALTNMALLNMEYDTNYVKYILEEMKINDVEKKAFQFYTLMYCVDFMGERGMQFMDKQIEVNEQIVDKLNNIYDLLWKEWNNII